MIKELRTGNLLFIPGLNIYVKVSSIFKTHFRCESENGILHDVSVRVNYQPIPLSMEILEKCGFRKTAPKHFIFNKMVFIFDEQNGHYVLVSDIKNVGIKYLHHLQNVIYFFTGEELKVNL